LRNARTLRPGSSIAVGVLGALAGIGLVVPALLSSDRRWGLIATVVLALVLLWLFVVRPAAVVHDEGIRLVNPMQVVDLSWPVITEVRSKWALELFAQGRKYTAWGVPADPARPKYGRGFLSMGANRVESGKQVPASKEPRRKVEAHIVAAEVEALIDADRKRGAGVTPRVAQQSWDRGSVGLLVAAVAFFLLGAFVL
jgi:Bacterial PH domain